MNIPELTKLAEWLEAGGDDKDPDGVKFYMPQYYTEDVQARGDTGCGAAACMAGAVVVRANKLPVDKYGCNKSLDIHKTAAEILGLDNRMADALFIPGNNYDEDSEFTQRGFDLDDVTPAWAARVVRDLIKTECVDWVGNAPDKEPE